MKKSLLNTAVNTANNHRLKHPRFKYKEAFMHYSFIVFDNRIIEWGTNREGIPPVHMGYSQRIDDNEPKIHAELDAYRKAKGVLTTDRLASFEVINIRLNRQGQLRLSKPCICCYSFLKQMGCTKFYYSSDIGFLSCK